MQKSGLVCWIVLAGLCFSIADAQENAALWNAAKRVKFGLDAATLSYPAQTGDVATPNPLSPPNNTDIQVFNPSLYWQSENSIGVSFTNTNHLMVSTNGRIPGANPVVHQTWAFSTDGGVTWPPSMQSEDLPPNIIDSFGDPVAFFDVSGRAYFCTLGSPGGIYFVSTTDFGTTWSARTNADNLNSTNDDKQHAAADYSGTYPNNIYAAWTDFGVTTTPVQFARSTDQGQTWLPRVALPIGSNRGQGTHIAIGPNGEVYVIWAHYTSGTAEVGIGMAKSTDGGATFNTPAIAFPINGIRISNGAITALNGTRASSFPYADVDRSNGPHRGWVYVVAPELDVATTGQSDIYLHRSSDGGTTWSDRIKINGPDVATGRWQWMPSIAVDPNTGGITVSYYSFDSTGSTTLANRYAAYSVDGGDTWDNWVISDVRATWAPQGTPSTNTTYNGDYYETTAAGGKAWAIWSDRRSGTTGASNRAYVERIIYGENFGWIRGTVTNTVGGATLQGVTIDFVENVLQQSGTSDASGIYFAGAQVDTPATTANLTLRAKKFGFLDTTLAVTLTRSDTLTRNFGMRPMDLVLTKSIITFPATPVPGTTRDSLIARNQFATSLTLSSLTTTNPDFAVTPANAVIPPLDSVKIFITYTPSAEGVDTGRVIVQSSSVYKPREDVQLGGTAIGVPRFTASVDSLTRTIEGGVRDSVTFRVRNTGTTSGNFSARALMFPRNGPNGRMKTIQVPVTVLAGPGTGGGELDKTAAQVPELLYYKFDEAGAGSTGNFASPGVGTNPAPLVGQTMGGAGQFGSALIGTGATNNYVNTGWNTDLGTGSWTISMWLSNLPNNTSLYYLWGDNTASSFRCFLGGAAGAGAITLRGTGITNVDVPGVAPGPTVVHFVYDATAGNIKAYRNGTLVTTVSQGTLNLNGTSPFKVGAYSTLAGLPSGGLMDEFRMYNRALSEGEIVTTWNTEIGGGNWFSVAPTTGTIAMNDSVSVKAYFDATDASIYNDPGEYLGRLDVIATNSELADTLRVPSRMFVIPPAGARISLDQDSLDFGDVEIDSSSTLSVLVRNIGASTLTVTGTTISDTSFKATPSVFTLASLDTQRVAVKFTAPSPGTTRTGTLQFVSNDPVSPTLRLRGRSVGVAHVVVHPDSFRFAVALGDSVSGTVTIRNTGLGELSYTSRIDGGFVGEDSTNVGSATTSLATSSALMRGGVVEVTSSVQLNEIKSWLTITNGRELHYVVYENTSGTSYTKIFEDTVNSGTGGPQWYSSGPINIVLQAGKKYAIGVNWPAASGLTYHYQLSSPVPVPISFGTITGGLALSVFPPPATATVSQTSTLYYTQLVTSSGQWMNILSGGSGTIASGDSAQLGFRAYTNLLSGSAQATVSVLTNDPLAPMVSIPVAVDITTDVAAGSLLPERYDLQQNFPNPFNPSTTIKFALPQASSVRLEIYNILGQRIATLADEIRPAGFFVATWNGTNVAGNRVSSGIYFYRMEARGTSGSEVFTSLKKMILLK